MFFDLESCSIKLSIVLGSSPIAKWKVIHCNWVSIRAHFVWASRFFSFCLVYSIGLGMEFGVGNGKAIGLVI